jgi:ribosomal protein S18 acetylase RimI-like enzyme
VKSNILIRKYKNSDLNSAIEVYKNLCKFYGLKFDLEGSKKFFSVRSYFEQYHTLVAFDTEKREVVGLAFSEVVTEETQTTSGNIKLIFVEEEYRRQGIMTDIISAAYDYFKEINADNVRIYLRNENLPYLSYYSEKLGFSPIITIVEKSTKST